MNTLRPSRLSRPHSHTAQALAFPRPTPRPLATPVLGTLVACAMAIVALLTSRAQAQQSFQEASVVINPLTTRSLESAKTTLGLDADQFQMAKELYLGYRTAMKTMLTEAEAKGDALEEKARESGDWGAVQKAQMGIVREGYTKTQALEKSFNDDLKAILTEEQAAKFPAFERARRREHGRLFQILPGEGADVIDILHSLKIDTKGNEEITSVLNEYEMNFDRAIGERLSLFKEAIEKVTDGDGMDEMKGMQLMTEYMPKVFAKCKASRDLNRQAARRVGELLSDEDKAKFQAEVNRRSFPSIYKVTGTQKKLDAALKIEDLTDSQKGNVESMRTTYLNQVELQNKAWADAVDAMQDEFGGDFTKLMMGEESKAAQTAQEKAAARRTLETETLEKLEKLLSAAQAEKLPASRPEDELGRLSMFEPQIDKESIKDWADDAE